MSSGAVWHMACFHGNEDQHGGMPMETASPMAKIHMAVVQLTIAVLAVLVIWQFLQMLKMQ